MKIRISLFILLYCSFFGASFAEDNSKETLPLPTVLSGVTTISAETLATMLSEDPGLLVIDARIDRRRNKGYIDGSIHLPDVETNCESLAKIIPSKSTKIIFYCSSSECGRSMNAVTQAQKCHYTNLYWFRGGFKDWKNSGYPYVK